MGLSVPGGDSGIQRKYSSPVQVERAGAVVNAGGPPDFKRIGEIMVRPSLEPWTTGALPPSSPCRLDSAPANVFQDLKPFHFALAIPITPWPTRPPAFPTGWPPSSDFA